MINRGALYKEHWTQAGVVEELFERFDAMLQDNGFLAMGGQIVDASIVRAPAQRNRRSENHAIKAGKVPADWEDKPRKRAQKDVDARWTKKHGKSHYGYPKAAATSCICCGAPFVMVRCS